MTSTPVKPADPQKQAPAQARPQAQAQIRPLAPVQPPRPAPAYFPQPQAAPPPKGRDAFLLESLIDEDRPSDFLESEASLIVKQARSDLLDRVAKFC